MAFSFCSFYNKQGWRGVSLTPAATIYSNPAVKRQEPDDSNGGSVSNHFLTFMFAFGQRVLSYLLPFF